MLDARLTSESMKWYSWEQSARARDYGRHYGQLLHVIGFESTVGIARFIETSNTRHKKGASYEILRSLLAFCSVLSSQLRLHRSFSTH